MTPWFMYMHISSPPRRSFVCKVRGIRLRRTGNAGTAVSPGCYQYDGGFFINRWRDDRTKAQSHSYFEAFDRRVQHICFIIYLLVYQPWYTYFYHLSGPIPGPRSKIDWVWCTYIYLPKPKTHPSISDCLSLSTLFVELKFGKWNYFQVLITRDGVTFRSCNSPWTGVVTLTRQLDRPPL